MRLLTAILLTPAVLALAQEPPTGLRVTFTSGGDTDTRVTPHIALFVPEGQPATPFLPPGKFTATWEGTVKIDLRGDYSFQATGRGGLKLEVNNAVLLDLPGLGGFAKPVTTKTVRLNKGANSIKVTYTSPNRGNAQLRLQLGDALSHRRLGQVHRARRQADAAKLHHGRHRGEMSDIELVGVHVQHLAKIYALVPVRI